MKYLFLVAAFTFLLTSCGEGEKAPEAASPELIEEIKTVEAENEVLETTIEELESSTEELDALLNDL